MLVQPERNTGKLKFQEKEHVDQCIALMAVSAHLVLYFMYSTHDSALTNAVVYG